MLSDEIFIAGAGSVPQAALGIFPDTGAEIILKDQQASCVSGTTRKMLDALPYLTWICEPDGSLSFLNKRWYEYTGISSRTPLSTFCLLKFLHPKDRKLMKLQWQKSKLTGTCFQIEYRWLRASDNKYRWHAGHAEPVTGPDGQILHWIGSCTDIEEKKQAEQLLLKKDAELRQINDDLDSFVYMSSHDLKLPIVNIDALFNEMLETVKFNDAEGPKMVRMVKESLEKVQETIRDLGDIVRVQKDINTAVDVIDFREALNEVELSLQDQIRFAKATILTDFSQAPGISFSAVNFNSILFNLISNAIKFRHKSRHPVIKLRSWRENNAVCLEVSDNGIGVDVSRHGGKMFQMFRRFHNHVPGSGLGLYIVNRAMQRCSGKVEVRSTPGQGAAFTLFFSENENNGE